MALIITMMVSQITNSSCFIQQLICDNNKMFHLHIAGALLGQAFSGQWIPLTYVQ